MLSRLITIAVVFSAAIVFIGCSKEKDVVPPYGSTITMPADTEIPAGNTVTLPAVIQDPDGNVMNGVGVIFRSNSNKASFSSSSIVTQTIESSDKNGIATATVYTFANSTGTAIIYGDIKVQSDSTTLTIKKP